MAKDIMTSGIEMSDVIKTTGFPVPEDMEGKTFAECVSGESIVAEPLAVTENGVYTAPSGKAYSPVTVNVPKKLYKYSYTLDAVAVDSVFFKEEPQVGVPIEGFYAIRTSYDGEACTEFISNYFTFSSEMQLSATPIDYPWDRFFFKETILL